MAEPTPADSPEALERVGTRVLDTCINCPLCERECAFLRRHGKPGEIAARLGEGAGIDPAMARECSLCGLCEAVCPVGVKPVEMFLAIRRTAAQRPDPRHTRLAAYEARGVSPRYSWMGLPQGCDTVFFPGCTLSGTRPATVRAVFAALQRAVPNLGLVLDCCSKPSHDLGRDETFRSRFEPLRDRLLALGVRTVLTACPNCHKVFSVHGRGLRTEFVYDHPALAGLVRSGGADAVMTVHDPCVARTEATTQDNVRRLAENAGVRIEEMEHRRETTLCCGEGGGVGLVDRDLAGEWTEKRVAEAGERTVLTYCAGCAGFLGRRVPTVHLLDLLADPERAAHGKARVWGAPFTYLNRLLLKYRFRRSLKVAHDLRRPYP